MRITVVFFRVLANWRPISNRIYGRLLLAANDCGNLNNLLNIVACCLVPGGRRIFESDVNPPEYKCVATLRFDSVFSPGLRRKYPNNKTTMSLERAVKAKIAGKRNAQEDKEAQEWIETILGAKFPPGETYDDVIRDGTILCQVMNKIVPGSIPKINTSGGQFKMMENINNFLAAMTAYGVAAVDLFQTVDLWEKSNIAQVTTALFGLGRETYKHPEWKGPYLGPKPSQENKREFTEEQLKAGETIIGLQAGQNKGATQAGQNIGAGRKILLGK